MLLAVKAVGNALPQSVWRYLALRVKTMLLTATTDNLIPLLMEHNDHADKLQALRDGFESCQGAEACFDLLTLACWCVKNRLPRKVLDKILEFGVVSLKQLLANPTVFKKLQEFCRQEGCQVPEYVRTYATTDNVSLNTLKDEIHAVKAALDSADLRPRIKKKIIPILQSDDSDIQPISMALEQKKSSMAVDWWSGACDILFRCAGP